MLYSIKTVEREIIRIIRGIIQVRAVYDYPIVDIGRLLPAVSIVYDGFIVKSIRADYDRAVDYSWTITVYLSAEGKNMDNVWGNVKDLVLLMLIAFKENKSLNDTCISSILESGEPIIKVTEPGSIINFVGHTFRLKGTL